MAVQPALGSGRASCLLASWPLSPDQLSAHERAEVTNSRVTYSNCANRLVGRTGVFYRIRISLSFVLCTMIIEYVCILYAYTCQCMFLLF